MRVIVDLEKWANNQDFYNEKYLNYIKKSWVQYRQYHLKKIQKVKKDETKWISAKEIQKADDNLIDINYLLSRF